MPMAHKILAIDDHPETLSIVVATLEEYGYEVIGARSGIKGLSLVEKERPDLVLVDMMMPEMDGKEVCRRLRDNPDLAHIPIIMFTAMEEVEHKLAGFDAGADDYITKPTEPAELIERVKTLLKHTGDGTTETPPPEPKGTRSIPRPPTADLPDQPVNTNLIAVIGARGGAGTTTVAINLAASTARICPTTLVDLDVAQGHIALYLNQKEKGYLNALAALSEEALPAQVPQQLVQYSERLRLMLAQPNLDGRSSSLSPGQTMTLMETLLEPGHAVVVDLGREITAVSRIVLEQADQVIVCLRPERVSLSAAKRLLGQLQKILFPHTTLSALMIDLSGDITLPKDAVESFLGHPLLATVPVQQKEMAQAVNKSVALVQLHPKTRASKLFRQLAEQFVTVS